MNIITVDIESYYNDKGVGFRTQTTEEYVRDPLFEVIGVAVQVGDGEPEWFSGTHDETRKWLKKFDWKNSLALAHNTLFDGAILAWHFKIKPMGWLDTLSMARALHGVDAGGSLKKLALRYEIGEKGTEVEAAINKHRLDFTPEDLAQYGEYCKNDVRLTYQLFQLMVKDFPMEELHLIDMTLQMFTHPILEVNDSVLEERLAALAQEKSELLSSLMEKLNATTEEEVRKKLSSNKQFAEVLEGFGITVPMKHSEKQKKDVPALAKKDEGFIALTEHEDPFIQQLCAVRLGTKSTLEVKRIERFRDIAKRNHGLIPIPLKYYGAHTGRWSGVDKVNFQNLPSRDPKKKALKKAIVAPEGYHVINCDSSQIEARMVAWLAGQDDVVEQFARGDDVYSLFASAVYERKITKADAEQRFVGKTCLAEGTLVLSDSGWKPIECVTTADKLWDGEEWVCHQGLVNNGIKQTLNLSGVWLTPDHQVWSGTQWLEAQYLVQDANIRSRALATAAANLPLPAMYGEQGEASVRLSSDVTADLTSTVLTHIISRASRARAVPSAPVLRVLPNGTGCIQTRFQTTNTEPGFSIDWLLPSHGVTPQPIKHTLTTEGGAYRYTSNGERIEPRFYTMYKRLKAGMYRVTRWTGLMSTETTNPATFDSCLEVKTSETKDVSQTLRTVFDILNCGSRNRFTVLTEDGPLIVHNCILGLGYGTGAAKLQHTLATSQPISVKIDLEESKRIVGVYRDTNDKIIDLWAEADAMLNDMMNGSFKNGPKVFGKHDCVFYDKEGVILPNGLRIRYPNLRREEVDGKSQIVYDSRKGAVSIWGGSVVENVVQALARIVVGVQMLQINTIYRVVLTVHDAAVVVVPEDEVEAAKEAITGLMGVAPDWAKGLPVASEAKSGPSYGDC